MNVVDIAISKSYVKATAEGMGAVKGKDGKDGSDGASAYEVAVANGFTGTEEQWLASLKGDKGDTGTTGAKGEQGLQGEQGESGYSPTITENADNSDSVYKLNITDVNGTITTPNLKGDNIEFETNNINFNNSPWT